LSRLGKLPYWIFEGIVLVFSAIDYYRYGNVGAVVLSVTSAAVLAVVADGIFKSIKSEIKYRAFVRDNPFLISETSDDRVRIMTGLGLIVMRLAWLCVSATFFSESFLSSLLGVIVALAVPVFVAGLGVGFIWVSIDRRQKAADQLSDATDK
jgi:hypothetical protein